VNTFLNKLSKYIAEIIMWLIIPLMIVVVYGVLVRYLFKNPDIRSMFISECFFGLIYALGGAYALKTGSLVSVDIIYSKSPTKVRKYLDAFIHIVIIVSCAALIAYAMPWAWRSFLMRETSTAYGFIFQPEIWWLKWVLIASIALVLLQGIIMAWDKVRGERSDR